MIGERETNVEKLFGKAGEGNFLKPTFVKQVKLLNKHTQLLLEGFITLLVVPFSRIFTSWNVD